jgi:hypothetical protein
MAANGFQKNMCRGARVEHKSAALSGEFGMRMFEAKFPAAQRPLYLAKLGVYSRGLRKGMPRGYIHWIKVVEGGWDYSDKRRGVLRRGTYEWVVRETADECSAEVCVPNDPRTSIAERRARLIEWFDEDMQESIGGLCDIGAAEIAIEAVRKAKSEKHAQSLEKFDDRAQWEISQYDAEVEALLNPVKEARHGTR